MNIRRAGDQDIADVMRLLLQVEMVHHRGRPDLFKESATKYTEAQLRAIFLDENKPVFVYTNDDDKVLGYAFCIRRQFVGDTVMTDVPSLYIDDLCVDEQTRGCGIGRALYRYVVDYARENGYYNVTLNVWTLNEDAMKFYEKCGMKPQKIGMETILQPGAEQK